MVRTTVDLRIGSTAKVLSTQLETEPCLDTCFCLPYCVVFQQQHLSLMTLLSHPTPVYPSWGTSQTRSQMLRYKSSSWGRPVYSQFRARAVTTKDNIPPYFSVSLAKAAEFLILEWTQASLFRLSSSWLFQALWWHRYRFPATQAAWIWGSLHTASKFKRYLSKIYFFIKFHRPTC